MPQEHFNPDGSDDSGPPPYQPGDRVKLHGSLAVHKVEKVYYSPKVIIVDRDRIWLGKMGWIVILCGIATRFRADRLMPAI